MESIYAKYPWGFFADPETGEPTSGEVVVAQWCRDNSRDMVLTQPLLYIAPNGRSIRVTPPFRTNGLSAPRFFWRLVSPYEPLSREASVIHDYICWIGWDWIEAAYVFYCAMRANGVGPVAAWLRWAAVRFVGKWFPRHVLTEQATSPSKERRNVGSHS